VSELIATLRALVRAELARVRAPALGAVTKTYPRTGDDGKDNHQVDLELLDSGVELSRVPVAVSRLGLSALPSVGDLLVVVFVGGDLNAPIAIGCVYDDTLHPPVAKDGEVVYQPPEDEDSSVRRLHIELQNGGKLTVDDEKLTLELGGTSLVINRDGDLTMKAKGKLRVESESDLELIAGGALKLEAQSDLTGKGTNATIEATGNAKLKGPALSIAGNIQFSAS
jgi:hypothetical protein